MPHENKRKPVGCVLKTKTQVVASLYDGGVQSDAMMSLATNDGEKEQEYCAGLGTCDFDTGQVRR